MDRKNPDIEVDTKAVEDRGESVSLIEPFIIENRIPSPEFRVGDLYDEIGKSYRATRVADPRISGRLAELLSVSTGAKLCDVGAGSGNYTNALADKGYDVIAVEPSPVMRSQADPHERVTWLDGTAERLPLPADCVDGVVCTLATHHFSDIAAMAREMHRICGNGPFVFFTVEPGGGEYNWFEDYFPDIRKRDLSLFPSLNNFMETVRYQTQRKGEVRPFPLPPDLLDNFMYAPWNRPEIYLDPIFRANTSGFSTADQAAVEKGLALLRMDLDSGTWDQKYANLRTRGSYDAGYRFIVFRRS